MEQADGIGVWSRDVQFDETKNGCEVVRKTNKESRLNPKDGHGEPTRVVEVYSSDSEEENNYTKSYVTESSVVNELEGAAEGSSQASAKNN